MNQTQHLFEQAFKVIVLALFFTFILTLSCQAQRFYRYKTRKLKGQPYVYYVSTEKIKMSRKHFRHTMVVSKANYNRKRKAMRRITNSEVPWK